MPPDSSDMLIGLRTSHVGMFHWSHLPIDTDSYKCNHLPAAPSIWDNQFDPIVLYKSLPEDDRSILSETSSCNLQFFSELITAQLRISHRVTASCLYLEVITHQPCAHTIVSSSMRMHTLKDTVLKIQWLKRFSFRFQYYQNQERIHVYKWE